MAAKSTVKPAPDTGLALPRGARDDRREQLRWLLAGLCALALYAAGLVVLVAVGPPAAQTTHTAGAGGGIAPVKGPPAMRLL